MKTKQLSLLCGAGGVLFPLTLAAQFDSGLIGYWQFENDLTDSSGAHAPGTHDGAAVGTPSYAVGPATAFGQALSLDGSNGVYVNGTNSGEAGYLDTFDAGINNSLSISFWASGSPARWGPFVAKKGESGEGYQVRRHDTNISATFTLRATSGVDDPQGSVDIITPQPVWTHYVATYNATTGERKLYINGEEDPGVTQLGDNPAGGPGNAGAFWLTFGMIHTDPDPATFAKFFTGQMDDVAIWNRELSATESYQLSLAPVSDILTETDTDGDGLFDSQEIAFGTQVNNTDSDGDGVDDFLEFAAGGDGTIDDDPDQDGLTNSQETSGSANPWNGGTNSGTPGETTAWDDPDTDGDGVNDGEEVAAGLDGFITDPNRIDTDEDGFSDGAEVAANSDPTSSGSVPPITAGLVGYWEFDDDLVETSGAHTSGTHDGATTDGLEPEFTDGPTAAEDDVNVDFGRAIDLVNYGIYVQGSNSLETGYVDTFDGGIDNEFSVSFWAQGWPASNWAPFIAKRGESGEGFQIRRRSSSTNATFTLHGTTGAIDPDNVNGAGTSQPVWRHYLGTWNGATGERKLYIDGVLAFTVTNDFENADIRAADDYWLTFGARHNNADPLTFDVPFEGQIDDVAFWHRELKDTEVEQLSKAPLSYIQGQADDDQDGLFNSLEAEFGTNINLADTDSDGVSDYDEYQRRNDGADGTVDDDFDGDGLLNSQETSGSANPWVAGVNVGAPGETTLWDNADSDFDGLSDGEEVSAGDDGYITDPNRVDTDGDGFADGNEVFSNNPSDPTNELDVLTEWERGLIGYWKFDNDLTDSAYLQADGTMAGLDTTETYVTAQFGQGIDLDKANTQRVEITSVPEDIYDLSGGDITVSTWVQVEALSTNWQAIIAKGEGSSWRLARWNNGLGAAFSAGTGNAGAPNLQETSNAYPLNDEQWHHVVGRAKAGESLSIWVDGVLVEHRTDLSPNITDSVANLVIGGNPDVPTRTWNGAIDDVAIWKRALSDDEVATLFYDGNELAYLIANDVTPSPAPVPVDIIIAGYGFNTQGDFTIDVEGLDATATYRLRRSVSLDGTDWEDVGDTFTGSGVNTFVDTEPLAKGFYQIVEVSL
ncbi:MAG: LamG-like jellyroll fold domain-containing protein [Verrucomicrobiota bacterium JB023]|nr:LamG-like jellyroll fold domain-containing protein [Verrucomicrobiota bacterium JB023]